MCSCGGSRPANPGGGSPAQPGSPSQCPTCTVTLLPRDRKICGAGNTGTLTATGSPAGGTYAFQSGDASIATVSGSNNTCTVTAVGAGTVTITVTYTVPGCTPCTANVNVKVCTCTPGRKYAYVLKSLANLIGGKTRIKTRYGKLCCEIEGCSTEAAFHAVYVNISNESGDLKWAQVGFSRRRNAGGVAIIQYRKAEINGDNYFIDFDTAHAPAEGSVHEWKVELDKATGTWSYYDNGGAAFRTYVDNFFTSHLGTNVSWVGEIYNMEDDMPGTSGNKCNFTECQYRVEGHSFKDAAITAAELHNSDNNQWGAERVSGTAFNIWDKHPNT